MKTYDTIVLGLGAMGSASAYHLAKSGASILGLEQFGCAHDKGSSHGESRLIRKAYFEHPDYVPLLERSYELWRELEKVAQTELLKETGLVIFGSPTCETLKGVEKSASQWKIPIEKRKVDPNFPFHIPENYTGIFEATGGFLWVEKCVEAHCKAAEKLGADLHFNEEALSWKSTKDGVEVKTSLSTYSAKKLVITAGPWARDVVKDLGVSLKVHRVPLFWFESEKPLPDFSCYAFEMPGRFFYGFPPHGKKFKIALHLEGEEVKDPSKVSRVLTEADSAPVENFLKKYFKFPFKRSSGVVCMYTMTADSHFILDLHPKYSNVAIAAGFSGHGFKFSSVVGEVMRDLSLTGKTNHPIDFLRLKRF